MTKNSASKINPELLTLFQDSTLGLYLDGIEAEVFSHGKVQHLAPGAVLEPAGERAWHVVLDGRLAGARDWYGPGNHFAAEAQPMTAVDMPARVWTLDTGAALWATDDCRPLRAAFAKALIGTARAEAEATPPDSLPAPDTLCDFDHPEIRRQAARLRRATPASTAEAILKFVQLFPYRFGYWQERASDTLNRGVGMCTTKANLQVALMRASGLEAGFAEIAMSTGVLGNLMPAGWRALQRPVVKHYFAAVKLGGVWHGADSSYDPAAVRIYLQVFPTMGHVEYAFLAEGRPYIPSLECEGRDMFAIEVVPHLNEEMGKKSRFDTRHFESLNTRLDRARGVPHRPVVAPAAAEAEVRA